LFKALYTFCFLGDLFNRTPSGLVWATSSHAAVNTEDYSYTDI